jgi:hypothetical protein
VNITDNDQFGLSVAMGTSLIACGAPNANNGDGSVYVFDGRRESMNRFQNFNALRSF